MYVRSAVKDGQTRENNCDLRRIYPWQGVVVPPWNSSLVSIRPQESSQQHAHATDETFIFTGGEGVVRVGDEERVVAEGDVIYIPHDNQHIVTNTSDRDPLTFVSIYWLQPAPAEESAHA
ncbi:cupin domain-containing protein [Kitasatospora sp. NPDC088351]|uniref:cupin domain-containing protein n=1 Tax=unclassified Kitasatospora TaxID=2633591 RepID=UPI003432C1D8